MSLTGRWVKKAEVRRCVKRLPLHPVGIRFKLFFVTVARRAAVAHVNSSSSYFGHDPLQGTEREVTAQLSPHSGCSHFSFTKQFSKCETLLGYLLVFIKRLPLMWIVGIFLFFKAGGGEG